MGFLEIFLSMLAWEAGSAVLSPALEFVTGSRRLEDLQVEAQRIQARNQDIAQRRVVTDERAGLLARDAAKVALLPKELGALQAMDPANYDKVAAQNMPTAPQAPAPVAPGVRTGGPSAPPADPKLQAAMVGGMVNPVLLDQLEASLG